MGNFNLSDNDIYGDDYADDVDGEPTFNFWDDVFRKNKPKLDDQFTGPPKRVFKLAEHHLMVTGGYGRYLLPGTIDPRQHKGLLVLTLPDGCPVVRLHGDLKENEVGWVLR